MPRTKRKRSYGTGGISERRRKSGVVFEINWPENGKTKTQVFRDRETAARVLRVKMGEVEFKKTGLPRDPKTVPRLGVLATEWLEARKNTHRSGSDDELRWTKHLKPTFADVRPDDVDGGSLLAFINKKRAEKSKKTGKKLAPATLGLCMRLLSSLYTDLVERGLAERNPVATLPRKTKALFRSDYDTKSTPFVEKLEDVNRIFGALEEPYRTAYAIGALAGLRTGEVLALDWSDVNIEARRLRVARQVRHGKLGRVKDAETRHVPIQGALHPLLVAWKERTGGVGQMLRPLADGRGCVAADGGQYIKQSTLNKNLADAMKACGLKAIVWKNATRHTYASHWVIGGGSIETLAETLGHSTSEVTRRYAHLRVDLFREVDYQRFPVTLTALTAKKPRKAALKASVGGELAAASTLATASVEVTIQK